MIPPSNCVLSPSSSSALRLFFFLLLILYDNHTTTDTQSQIKAAYSAGDHIGGSSSCSDAIRIVRHLFVSALESGDIDSWKASLIQESDIDAMHVDTIVQSIQVFWSSHIAQLPLRVSNFPQADPVSASRIRVQQVICVISLQQALCRSISF
jgi:hypothetical protein